jgi:alpha-tubulin suppressor-like RCC1 family protein
VLFVLGVVIFATVSSFGVFVRVAQAEVSVEAPTGLIVTSRTGSSVSLSWSASFAPAGSPVTDYLIEYLPAGGEWTLFNDGVTANTYTTVNGLTKWGHYAFRVAGVNADGQGPWATIPVNAVTPSGVGLGENHSCVVKAAPGELWCWGYNYYGQLGDSTRTSRSSPVRVGSSTDWLSVTAGNVHTCALKTSGELWCWGRNDYGKIGDDSLTDRWSPVRVGSSTDWVSVSAGGNHTCGLKTSGELWCWGSNYYGQLGDGSTVDRWSPVRVGSSTDWVSVSSGGIHTCGLKTSGELWCWGYNVHGQLGDGSTVDRWSPVRVGSSTDWVSVSSGGIHTCGLKTSGELWCWGYNGGGRLGDGTTTTRFAPVRVGAENDWVSLNTGVESACGLKTSGELWCWGYNSNGQLGDGTKTSRYFPVRIGSANDWAGSVSGGYHTCAIRVSGQLLCTGNNYYGQLGDGTKIDQTLLISVLRGEWVRTADPPSAPHDLVLSAPSSTSVLLSWSPSDDGGEIITDYIVEYSTDGSTWTIFDDGESDSLSTRVSGLSNATTYLFRVSAVNSVGQGVVSSSATRTTIGPPNTLTVTSRTSSTVSLTWSAPLTPAETPIIDYIVRYSTDGETWKIFDDGFRTATSATVTGLAKNGTYLFRVGAVNSEGFGPLADISMDHLEVHHVDSGNGYSCAVKTSGELWCWGDNESGKLGNGSTALSRIPNLIYSTSGWRSVNAGFIHTCAINSLSELWCWGFNGTAQVGDGSTVNRAAPVRVGTSTDWATVGAGTSHTCGVKTSGELWCWGWNSNGALGIGSTVGQTRPVRVGIASDWSSVASGNQHTCGLKNTHELFCWGLNESGQVGDGSATSRKTPVKVSGSDWSAVSNGESHTCALTTSGKLYCWGGNGQGQIGDGSNTRRYDPTQVGSSTDWASVSAGTHHTCAVTTSGELWCWGDNEWGKLGDGTTTSRFVPTQVGSATDWASVSAGNEHTCAAKISGELLCWGLNDVAQLGDGSTSNQTEPTTVIATRYIHVVGKPASVIGLTGSTMSSTSVSLTWSQGDDGGAPISDYIIEYSEDGSTWSTFDDGTSLETSATVTGLTNAITYKFRVSAVNGEGQGQLSSEVTAIALGAPTALTLTSKSSSSVSLMWNAPPTSSELPIIDYFVEFTTDGNWVRFNRGTSNATSAEVSGLSAGGIYDFRVSAVTPAGPGPWVRLSDGNPFGYYISVDTPLAPDIPIAGTRTTTSASLSWARPNEDGMTVTSFKLRYSSNNGATWSTPSSIGDVTSWTFSGLPSATARLVQIAVMYGGSQSAWSESLLVTTKGVKETRVTVKDSTGEPISGGAITWRMTDGSVRSSKTYGLTANGVIDFPAAPAGQVQITLTGGLLSSGIVVSGTWTTTLGFETTTVVTPETGITSRQVLVRIPDGPPVPGAVVTVTSGTLGSTKTVAGFKFSMNISATTQLTDSLGLVTFDGFFSGVPKVAVEYDDGVLTQSQTGITLTDATTAVELEYLPYADVGNQVMTVDAGTAVNVTVSVKSRSSSSLFGLFRNNLHTSQAGVPVTLVLPDGVSKGTCGARLTSTTNKFGKATFKVCATQTGTFGLKASGVVLRGSVTLKVRGTAPTSPTSLSARSLSVGSVRVAWNTPYYNGNAAVTGYTIVLSAPGQPTKTSTTTKLEVNFKDLANATRYKVTVYAQNKFGRSAVATTYVSVA